MDTEAVGDGVSGLSADVLAEMHGGADDHIDERLIWTWCATALSFDHEALRAILLTKHWVQRINEALNRNRIASSSIFCLTACIHPIIFK